MNYLQTVETLVRRRHLPFYGSPVFNGLIRDRRTNMLSRLVNKYGDEKSKSAYRKLSSPDLVLPRENLITVNIALISISWQRIGFTCTRQRLNRPEVFAG